MKKELLAATLLLALILGAFFHISHTEKLTQAVAARVSLSQAAVEQGDFEAARNALRSAWERWTQAQRYTGVFISGRDLESVDSAFFSLRSALLREDPAAAQAACEELFFQLRQLAEKEKPSLETVL